MCTKLIQIYQKRTPTFLAEVTVLVAVVLMLLQQPEAQCGLQGTLYRFYWAVLGAVGLELALKLVIFTVLYWQNRELANSFNTIVLFMVAGVHLALWIYSIGLYSDQELAVCHKRDQFFMKSYVYAYGIMIIGGAFVFIVLVLSAIGVTVATLRRTKPEEGDEDIDI